MKRNFPITIVAVALALVTSGCTNEGTTSSTAANPTKRTYSQSDLQNTGVNTTGEAVHKLVPAATVTGR